MHRIWVPLAVTQVDDWIAYRGNGVFHGSQADFEDEVYISLFTYTYGTTSVPFVGTCDSVQLVEYIL